MKYNFLKLQNLAVTSLIFAMVAVTACNSGSNSNTSDSTNTNTTDGGTADNNTILGAGSTFIYPFFSKAFSVYNQQTGVKVNYQSVGSGAGIQQLISKTVDFGDSDAPMNGEQDSTAGVPVLHIPMCSGAVAISYNLPDVKDTLNLTPAILANMFLGKITKWNDPAIAAVNKGVKLSGTPVVIAHRSDGSGTTNIFTTYLSKVSNEWNTKVGKGSSINWPIGLGAKGSEGVAGIIKQTPGAIGYIELAYALQNNMAFAKVQNKSGNYITPNITSTSAAGNIQLPADSKVSLTNTDAADGYPISGFTWHLFIKNKTIIAAHKTGHRK